MKRMVVFAVVGLLASSQATTAQDNQRPNFSGNWTLVTALHAGVARGDGAESVKVLEPRPIKDDSLAAAFNCGSECTVKQSNADIVVEGVKFKEHVRRPPAISLPITGRATSIPDPTSKGRTFSAAAKWVNNGLQIDTTDEGLSFVQTLTIEKHQLVVITEMFLFGERRHQYTFRYDKK